MENNAVYLAKIQSLRKSINEKTLTSYPVFKNNKNLEDFLSKRQFTRNHNETTINFKEFDEKIKPNKIKKPNEEPFLRLCPTISKVSKENKPKFDNHSLDESLNDLPKPKIESILTTVGMGKKNSNHSNTNSSNNDNTSEINNNLITARSKIEKNSSNKLNKNFTTSIDGKKIDDTTRNQSMSPLTIESLPTSASLLRKSNTTIGESFTNRQPSSIQSTSNLSFTLPKMTTQYPVRTTSPSLLANVNDIINRSSKMSNINSVKKIRKLLYLDDFATKIESSKKNEKKNLSKGHKLKTSLSLNKNDTNRVYSGFSLLSDPVSLSQMLTNTKINPPNNLTPIQYNKRSKRSIEKPIDDNKPLINVENQSVSKYNDNQTNYMEKKSYTEFSFKVFITDRSLCPPVTPNDKPEHKIDCSNCLFCASLSKGNLFSDNQEFLSQSANFQLQKQYEQYLITMN